MLLLLFIIIILKNTKKKFKKNFICFCTLLKKENLYVRDIINYHKSIGFDKFILVDNNDPHTEKLSDVLQDYINSGLVEIENAIGKSINQGLELQYLYNKYKQKCQWLSFFDSDEFLVLYPQNGKNITIKQFLTNPRYDKCESVLFNWLMYDDNDLLHYDNRSLNERFIRFNRNNPKNKFVKPIARGGLNKKLFGFDKSCHFPSKDIILCDSSGNTSKQYSDVIDPPIFEFAQLSHFSTKSTEEFINKAKRGYAGYHFPRPEECINLYFEQNYFTEEKLKIFEDGFNQTFPEYHRRINMDNNNNTNKITNI